MPWRLEPPVQDPLPVTRQRVAASAAAVCAAVAGWWVLAGLLDGGPGTTHDVLVAAAVPAGLVAGRGVYTSVLSRLAPAQLSPWRDGGRRRGDLLFDAAVAGVAGVATAWWAVSDDPWLVLATAAWFVLAVDQLRMRKAAARPSVTGVADPHDA